MRARLLGVLLLITACTKRPPERVFVPSQPFTHVVEVSVQPGATLRVGEWLTLHARRTTGPWTEVDRLSLGPEGCWVAPPPPAVEAEVADNLRWIAEPKTVHFNLDFRPDHTRRVRFSAPGRYVLHASSTTWCSPNAGSNELAIVVTE